MLSFCSLLLDFSFFSLPLPLWFYRLNCFVYRMKTQERFSHVLLNLLKKESRGVKYALSCFSLFRSLFFYLLTILCSAVSIGGFYFFPFFSAFVNFFFCLCFSFREWRTSFVQIKFRFPPSLSDFKLQLNTFVTWQWCWLEESIFEKLLWYTLHDFMFWKNTSSYLSFSLLSLWIGHFVLIWAIVESSVLLYES